MKIEGLKKDTPIWVRGYADGFGDIDFLDGERTGLLDCLCKDNIPYMSDSDFRLDESTQPQLEVPQMIFDVIESFDSDAEYLHEHLNHQSDEVREWLTHNERDFYEAWLAYPNITVQKEKLYRVKLNDHLYFKEFIDSMFPVFVIDDMPGALDEAFIGKKELALKHAREFGGRLEEVEEVTE